MTTILIALDTAVLAVSGDGSPAAVRVVVDGLAPTALLAARSTPAEILCGTFDHGLWRGGVGGDRWVRSEDGLPATRVTALGGGGDSSTVWAGTEPSAIFRSDNLEGRWREQPGLAVLPSSHTWRFPPRPYTHHVRWIEVDPFSSDTVYVSIEAGGVMRTRDGGRTWFDRVATGPRDVHCLRTHPQARERLYAAAGEGYHESDDGGVTWKPLGDGIRHGYLWSTVVDPRDPDAVLVTAALGPGAAHAAHGASSTLYRRRGSASWQEATVGLPPPAGTQAAVLATAPDGVVYWASNRGLYRSVDFGGVWEAVLADWPGALSGERANAILVVD